MKFITQFTSSILVLVYLLIAYPCLAVSERRTALVIGNSAYETSPLMNPVNDAVDLAHVLSELGFKVTIKTDADQKSMEKAVHDYGIKLRAGGVGLFFFAGHGLQVNGRNYLIPIGSDILDEFDVKFEAVDAGRILGKMENAGNKLNIIILDACRNNPFGKDFRSTDRGLAKMDAPTGSILSYSTAPGSVAADGAGSNGLFTSKLLKYIPQKGITIEDCFKRVRVDVMAESENRQVPWESSSLTERFYFAPQKKVAMVSNDASPSPSLEYLYWESIKDSKDIKQYQSYIEKFPDGTFDSLAKIYIEKYDNNKNTIIAKSKGGIKNNSQKSSVRDDEIVSKDEPLIKDKNGIIFDTETGLEWFVGPDKKTSWIDANSWASQLKIDGGSWRLPELEELKTLHKKGTGSNNLSHLISITKYCVYSGSGLGVGSAWCFNDGSDIKTWDIQNRDINGRALATRSASYKNVDSKFSEKSSPKAKKNKIAFLPSDFTRTFQNTAPPVHQYDMALNALNSIDDLEIVHLYVDSSKQNSYPIWKNKSVFAASEIDITMVKEYCKSIDTDLALILRTTDSGELIELWLISIDSGELIKYVKYASDYVSILQDIDRVVKKTLSEYVAN